MLKCPQEAALARTKLCRMLYFHQPAFVLDDPDILQQEHLSVNIRRIGGHNAPGIEDFLTNFKMATAAWPQDAARPGTQLINEVSFGHRLTIISDIVATGNGAVDKHPNSFSGDLRSRRSEVVGQRKTLPMDLKINKT
jgi:hypothetical protein